MGPSMTKEIIHMNTLSLRSLFALIACATLTLAISACGDDGDDVENPEAADEQEVITTMNLTFTPDDGGDAITAQFRDADGDGGEDPTQTDIVLAANTTYTLEIELLNETVPEDDEEFVIGNEIKEEAEEHQYFFSGTAIPDTVTHAYDDKESDYGDNAEGDDLPVGIRSTITAGDAGNGTFIVSLSHLPPVNDTPVKVAGVDANAGETDLEVTFDLTVE